MRGNVQTAQIQFVMLFHARAKSVQLVPSCSFCKGSEPSNTVLTRIRTNQASILDSNPLRGDESFAFLQETGLLGFAGKDEIGDYSDCHRQYTLNEENVPPLAMRTVQGRLLSIFLDKGNQVERTVP